MDPIFFFIFIMLGASVLFFIMDLVSYKRIKVDLSSAIALCMLLAGIVVGSSVINKSPTTRSSDGSNDYSQPVPIPMPV